MHAVIETKPVDREAVEQPARTLGCLHHQRAQAVLLRRPARREAGDAAPQDQQVCHRLRISVLGQSAIASASSERTKLASEPRQGGIMSAPIRCITALTPPSFGETGARRANTAGDTCVVQPPAARIAAT